MAYEHTTPASETVVRVTMMTIVLNRPTDTKPEFPFRHAKNAG